MFFPFFGSGPVPFLPGGGGGTESSLYIINSKDTSKQNVIRLHPLTPGGGGVHFRNTKLCIRELKVIP